MISMFKELGADVDVEKLSKISESRIRNYLDGLKKLKEMDQERKKVKIGVKKTLLSTFGYYNTDLFEEENEGKEETATKSKINMGIMKTSLETSNKIKSSVAYR
jgi:hypothetical protein